MSDKFKKEQKYILKQLEQEVTMAILGPQGFVYRTRGGATASTSRASAVYRSTMLPASRSISPTRARSLRLSRPLLRSACS